MSHKIIEEYDLNNFRCPKCNSPFFMTGSDSHIPYIQCRKSNCNHRIDCFKSAFNGVIHKPETSTTEEPTIASLQQRNEELAADHTELRRAHNHLEECYLEKMNTVDELQARIAKMVEVAKELHGQHKHDINIVPWTSKIITIGEGVE